MRSSLGFALLSIALVLSGASASARLGAPVRVIRDIEYRRAGGERLRLDAYLPSDPGGRPAIVFIHGGGWRAGDKAFFAPGERELGPTALRFARRGWATFSIDYRLGRFPAAATDALAAVRWVRARAARFGVDPTRIGVFGASAGGNLAAFVGAYGRGPRDRGSRVAVAVSWSGAMDLGRFDVAMRRYSSHPFVEDYIGCASTSCPARYAHASPVGYVDRSDPPMLIVNGSDEIVPLPQAREMRRRLARAGVPARLIVVPGRLHAADYSGAALAPTIQFFARYLARRQY